MLREVEGVVSSCIAYGTDGTLLSGCVNGTVVFLDGAGCIVNQPVQVFKKPVRNILSETGKIFCSSANGFASLLNNENQIVWRVKVSKEAISALCYLEDINQLAIGTDSGDLIVIDCDDPKQEYFRCEAHDDLITAIAYNPAKKMLITASGDGHIVVTDVKRSNCGKEHGRSECLEDEVLSLALMSRNSRIVTGTGLGFVNIFNWGYYGIPSQRIKGFKSEVSCLCKTDDETVLIGTSNGLVQLICGEKRGSSLSFEGHSIEAIDHYDGNVAHLDQNGTIWLWPLSDLTSNNNVKKKHTHADNNAVTVNADETIDRQTFLDGFA